MYLSAEAPCHTLSHPAGSWLLPRHPAPASRGARAPECALLWQATGPPRCLPRPRSPACTPRLQRRKRLGESTVLTVQPRTNANTHTHTHTHTHTRVSKECRKRRIPLHAGRFGARPWQQLPPWPPAARRGRLVSRLFHNRFCSLHGRVCVSTLSQPPRRMSNLDERVGGVDGFWKTEKSISGSGGRTFSPPS